MDQRVRGSDVSLILTVSLFTAAISYAEMPEQVTWPDQADCGGLAWTRTFS
jgi:hypothetical protein